MASVARRLISSGMPQSLLRRPDSTWATSIHSFLAVSAQAMVEFTSPHTTTRSGLRSRQAFSNSIITPPVFSAWLPPPTPRWMCGLGRPRSSKNTSDMFLS